MDSFTERFHLPPRDKRSRGLNYHKQLGQKSPLDADIQYGGLAPQNPDLQAFVDFDWDAGNAYLLGTLVVKYFYNRPLEEAAAIGGGGAGAGEGGGERLSDNNTYQGEAMAYLPL